MLTLSRVYIGGRDKKVSILYIFGERCYGDSFAKIGNVVLNTVVRENLNKR